MFVILSPNFELIYSYGFIDRINLFLKACLTLRYYSLIFVVLI